MTPLYLAIFSILVLVFLLAGVAYLSYLQQKQRQNRNQQAIIQHLPKIATTIVEKNIVEEVLETTPDEKTDLATEKVEIIVSPEIKHTDNQHENPSNSHTHNTTHSQTEDKKKRFLKNWIWGEILGK